MIGGGPQLEILELQRQNMLGSHHDHIAHRSTRFQGCEDGLQVVLVSNIEVAAKRQQIHAAAQQATQLGGKVGMVALDL